MCLWCLDPSCHDGEKCRFRPTKNPFTNSTTYQNAVQRITQATGREVLTSPGAFWDGRRPSFLPGVRAAVMNSGAPCGICHKAMAGPGHADHITPWRTYTEDAAGQAMAERGLQWTDESLPDDFVRVMSSDMQNLQPAHARCNEQKSDSTPGQRAGATRAARREAERLAAEKRRLEQEAKMKRQAEAWRDSHLDEFQGWRRRRGPGPGGAGGGCGGAIPA